MGVADIDKDRERALLGNVPPNLYESNCAPDFNEFLETSQSDDDSEPSSGTSRVNGVSLARTSYSSNSSSNAGQISTPDGSVASSVGSMIGAPSPSPSEGVVPVDQKPSPATLHQHMLGASSPSPQMAPPSSQSSRQHTPTAHPTLQHSHVHAHQQAPSPAGHAPLQQPGSQTPLLQHHGLQHPPQQPVISSGQSSSNFIPGCGKFEPRGVRRGEGGGNEFLFLIKKHAMHPRVVEPRDPWAVVAGSHHPGDGIIGATTNPGAATSRAGACVGIGG
ncbi:unnamed protein product [Notodromas monacha]|uniref:Uncharacterized protein n=1 Tax=Notodromas monacha TaxID=399045 RepID=A0A7R9BBN3_9CRUS|nr:unnamed protein product [Notodromas monacha]CAG0912326.1 unnamed protein product [Notodromas monacha]